MLINFIVDARCDNLSTTVNRNITCSSGKVGVGYTGDTCNFTCGNDSQLETRTCQSNGSWNGSICRKGTYHNSCVISYVELLYV